VSELDPPPDSDPHLIIARCWPVAGWWRYDVQFPGPPRGRASGERATQASALSAAADELRRLAGERV
jgi:hypothetical protein